MTFAQFPVFPFLILLLAALLFFLCHHAFPKGPLPHLRRTRRTYDKAVHPELRAIETSKTAYRRAVLMSCPHGPSHTHRGGWKPSDMLNGVEAVVSQMKSHKSSLPLLFGYYPRERRAVEPWCAKLSRSYGQYITIECFEIPESYPVGLYGYAKIFAIRHAPADTVLWLDCDVYPVRDLEPLFDDSEFKRTHAMFWPDSRDFFDEHRAARILSEKGKIMFPPTAWYVRQGFDSGLVLLNRKRCAEQIHHISQIARNRGTQHIRKLSMGDKDVFHVVWMLHERNFTFIPFIAETGSIQTAMRTARRLISGRRRLFSPTRLQWQMSSQLKYGRDGNVYAFHQLHQQPPYSLIATLAAGKGIFHPLRVSRTTAHVKPLVIAMADLRLIRPGYRSRAATVGDFVGDIESALIKPGNRVPTTGLEEGREFISRPYGLAVRLAPQWMHIAAMDMSKAWKYGFEPTAAAQAIYNQHKKMMIQQRFGGKYTKEIYRRMWEQPLQNEERRRFIRTAENKAKLVA